MNNIAHGARSVKSYVRNTPLEKMLRSFPLAHEMPIGSGQFTNDDAPRFGFREAEDGKILLHSWTGRTPEDVLAMGTPPLHMSDLFPANADYKPRPREKQLTLLELAEYYRLPWQFLIKLGYADGYVYKSENGYKSACVKIGGYCTPDGREHSKVKVRKAIAGKVRFLWDRRTPGEIIPCGLHRLGAARDQGYLFIGEGESDAATMWFHGFPFLGVSGADTVKRVDVSLLHDIPRVYLIEEPDQAQKLSETGGGFYANMRDHLRAGGYTGEIFSIRFKLATGHKDPSALHKVIFDRCHEKNEGAFLAEVRAVFAQKIAEALDLAIPEGNAGLDHQEDDPIYAPPSLPETEHDFRAFVTALNRVSAEVMSPAAKIVLQVLVLQAAQQWNADGMYWYPIDSYHLCKMAGMSHGQFLVHLSYLAKSLGLFQKIYVRDGPVDEETGKLAKITRQEVQIRPAPRVMLAYPSTYHLVAGAKQRDHGGPRKPKTPCPTCNSQNTVDLQAVYCIDCHRLHYTWPNGKKDSIIMSEPGESTADVRHLPKCSRRGQDAYVESILEDGEKCDPCLENQDIQSLDYHAILQTPVAFPIATDLPATWESEPDGQVILDAGSAIGRVMLLPNKDETYRVIARVHSDGFVAHIIDERATLYEAQLDAESIIRGALSPPLAPQPVGLVLAQEVAS